MGYHLDKQILLKIVERNVTLYEQLNCQMLKEVALNEAATLESESKDSLNKGVQNSSKVESFCIKK